MGTGFLGFLLIDDNTPTGEPPFSGPPSYWDLTNDVGLRGCKNYAFYAAIAGIRNASQIEPLIHPRGICPLGNFGYLKIFDRLEESFGVGWLTLSEIRAAITHMGGDPKWIADPISLVLNAMELIESRHGKDRARLLFGFD